MKIKVFKTTTGITAVVGMVFVPLVAVFTLSCASKPRQKSNLSAGVVKTKVKKGITSQSEIIKLLGSPNIITKNKAGNEVWTYSRQSFDSQSGGFAGGLLFFGSKAFSSSASSTFDLIITFDENDIVKDYSIVSSQF